MVTTLVNNIFFLFLKLINACFNKALLLVNQILSVSRREIQITQLLCEIQITQFFVKYTRLSLPLNVKMKIQVLNKTECGKR